MVVRGAEVPTGGQGVGEVMVVRGAEVPTGGQ